MRRLRKEVFFTKECIETMIFLFQKVLELENMMSDMVADAFPIYKVFAAINSVLTFAAIAKKLHRKGRI